MYVCINSIDRSSFVAAKRGTTFARMRKPSSAVTRAGLCPSSTRRRTDGSLIGNERKRLDQEACYTNIISLCCKWALDRVSPSFMYRIAGVAIWYYGAGASTLGSVACTSRCGCRRLDCPETTVGAHSPCRNRLLAPVDSTLASCLVWVGLAQHESHGTTPGGIQSTPPATHPCHVYLPTYSYSRLQPRPRSGGCPALIMVSRSPG